MPHRGHTITSVFPLTQGKRIKFDKKIMTAHDNLVVANLCVRPPVHLRRSASTQYLIDLCDPNHNFDPFALPADSFMVAAPKLVWYSLYNPDIIHIMLRLSFLN